MKFKIGEKVKRGSIVGYVVGEKRKGLSIIEVEKTALGWGRDGDVPSSYRSVASDSYRFVDFNDFELAEEEKPQKFKVGDRVRVVNSWPQDEFNGFGKDFKGTIVEDKGPNHCSGNQQYILDNTDNWGFGEKQLELVNEAYQPLNDCDSSIGTLSDISDTIYSEMMDSLYRSNSFSLGDQCKENKPKKTIMKTISNAFKKFISADLQAQVKASYRNGDLELTQEGKDMLLNIIANEPIGTDYAAKLTDAANEKVAEEEKQK